MNKCEELTTYLGYGLGLRSEHYQYILANKPAVDWFEAITEDYLVPGGYPLYCLEQIREHYPVVLHGVSLSIGGTDPLNLTYLNQVKQLAERIKPMWISDHLAWTGVNGFNMHDLLPLPYTEDTLTYVADRIKQVQDILGRQLIIENVSSYISYLHSHMTEWEFLATLAEKADCKILLDINNIYVSAYNHGFNAQEYLQTIPVNRVQQFHLAGHSHFGRHIIDTHDEAIIEEVWQLYADAVQRFGKVSTMIERDDNIPEFPELLTELQRAKNIADPILKALHF